LTEAAAGGPVRAGLEAHLASCARCRLELALLQDLLAVADGEMGGLAAAEPSPALGARIRQAVADQALAQAEPTAAWRLGWLWTATAVAVPLLVALALWKARGPEPAPGPRLAVDGGQPSDAAAPVVPRDAGSPGPEESAVAASPTRVLDHRSRPTPTPAVVAGPEVLVPPGEAEALLRFAALLRHRTVEPGSLLVADLEAPLSEPRAVDIAPIEIVPLDPAETSGTD
jgi:hypothetical protein